MIAKREEDSTSASHRNALRASIVILGDHTVRYFVMRTHEISGCRAKVGRHCRLDPLPIAVVGEGGA